MKIERKVNQKLRAFLKPRLEKAKAALLERGGDLEDKNLKKWQSVQEMPAYWGFNASSAAVSCRKCGLVLPLAWKNVENPCLCGKPNPAVMAPLYAARLGKEELHKTLTKFYKKALEEVMLEEEGAIA